MSAWKPASHGGFWIVCREREGIDRGRLGSTECHEGASGRLARFHSRAAALGRADKLNGVEAVPKRILSVVDRCRTSGYVVKTLPCLSRNETVIRWHYADGSDAPDVSVSQAIERGLLVPRNDGLFGAETAQTWVAA